MPKADQIKTEKKSKIRSILKKLLLFTMLICFLTGIGLGGYFYFKYGEQFKTLYNHARILVIKSDRDTFRQEQTSVCYYADGSIMQTLKGNKDVYYLEYENLPQNVIKALLAVEDRKFYSHSGYDIFAILRAAKAYLEHDGEIRQGGSTITQQLARTIYLTNEKTVERKAAEIFIASGLEQKFSKEDILEFYLNNIYFAGGYYGIEAAARGYFRCSASELTLSQQAFLAGIPNSPSSYNPRLNFEKALERRDSVLRQMAENGYITEAEYYAAVAEEISIQEPVSERNNYEETYTYYTAVQALMQAEGIVPVKNFDNAEEEALYKEYYQEEYERIKQSLYTRGYRIYTSIDREAQKLLQQAVDDELKSYTETTPDGIYKFQGAAAAIDNSTGRVCAIVGGRSSDYDGYTLNRAYQSPRQPGSSVKPLIVYTPAFENGYTPDSVVIDELFEGGPRNSGGVYSGEIDVRQAVAVSKNTVAWKLFVELGIEKGLSYLLKMNFAHINEKDYYPAASLGGLSYGATVVEMASAYATIENSGIYRRPTDIVKITDAFDTVYVDNTCMNDKSKGTVESRRVYTEEAALMMTDVLQTVMKTGTGKKVCPEGLSCAGKTGTTNDQKDGWFAGFSSYYTVAVWVGYDYPRKVEDLMGNTYPGRIWQSFMQDIHRGLKPLDLPVYAGDNLETDLDSEEYDLELFPDTETVDDDYPESTMEEIQPDEMETEETQSNEANVDEYVMEETGSMTEISDTEQSDDNVWVSPNQESGAWVN